MKIKKGWFVTDDRTGDRTLEEQLIGLDWLRENCAGKTVLDIGCAEGLISIEMARRGAVAVHGVEIVPGHVAMGNDLRGELPITFEVGDCNEWRPQRKYDIVLALSLLHKLKNPTEAAAAFADAATETFVLRTPPDFAPTIVDWRSNFEPHHIGRVLINRGFHLQSGGHTGPRSEWVGIYTRG
jgi:SAM-dependent methyltransferase